MAVERLDRAAQLARSFNRRAQAVRRRERCLRLPSEHRIDRRDHVGELLVPRERRILDSLADRSNVAGGYGPNPILLEFGVISRPPNALASNLQIRAIVRLDHVPPPFTALLDQAPARCSTAAGRGASFRHERGWIARITLWTLGRAEPRFL